MRALVKFALAAAILALPLAPGFAEATNVALSSNGGVASQTSTCFGGPPGLGIDDNTNGNFFAGSVTHTCSGGEVDSTGLFDFWEVALGGGDHAIDKIVIFNRTDCCGDRIDPFRLTLFNDAVVAFSQDVATFVPDVVGGSSMTFELTGQIGDRVRVQLTHQNFLQLAEVQVFDQPIAPPVPLPATAILLAAGVGTLAAVRGRKRLHRS